MGAFLFVETVHVAERLLSPIVDVQTVIIQVIRAAAFGHKQPLGGN
jgi:hypothetical protein